MMTYRRRVVQVALLATLLATLRCGHAPATGPWSGWTRVRLDVEEMPLLSGTVELRVRSEGGKTLFETDSVARLLGAQVAETHTTSVLDPRDGRSELHESRSAGSGRRYLFGEDGYEVQRLSAEGRPERPLEEWSVTSSTDFTYPADARRESASIHDYYAMLYRLRDLDLREPGDEARIWVATSGGPMAYRVRVAESRSSSRQLLDTRAGAPRQLDLTELRLRIEPVDPERASEGFLRMEGETEIWVERDSKTLVELSGRVAGVPATIRLVLTEMG